jgi:hypothetical protein
MISSNNKFNASNVNNNLTPIDIMTYYYYLFAYFMSVCSFIYSMVWLQNRYDKWNGSKMEFMFNESHTDSESENEKMNKEIPYEVEMFDEYDNLDDNELTEEYVKDLGLNTITDTTPRGDVLMYYSKFLNSFIYYSKTKEIPYKYLETVARKYVIKYNCKRLYVDIRKEYEKGVQKYKEMKEKEEHDKKEKLEGESDKSKENKKKQLFVALKTYNRKADVNAKQKDKIYILKEQANRYSYRGRIDEYKEPSVEEQEQEQEDMSHHDTLGEVVNKQKLDFASFKKLNSTSSK